VSAGKTASCHLERIKKGSVCEELGRPERDRNAWIERFFKEKEKNRPRHPSKNMRNCRRKSGREREKLIGKVETKPKREVPSGKDAKRRASRRRRPSQFEKGKRKARGFPSVR